MVRQWQELLHGERYSAKAGPRPCRTFVKLAEAFRCQRAFSALIPMDLDDAIMEMITHDGPVIFDCLVEKA